MQYAVDSVAAMREASLAAAMGNADAEGDRPDPADRRRGGHDRGPRGRSVPLPDGARTRGSGPVDRRAAALGRAGRGGRRRGTAAVGRSVRVAPGGGGGSSVRSFPVDWRWKLRRPSRIIAMFGRGGDRQDRTPSDASRVGFAQSIVIPIQRFATSTSMNKSGCPCWASTRNPCGCPVGRLDFQHRIEDIAAASCQADEDGGPIRPGDRGPGARLT